MPFYVLPYISGGGGNGEHYQEEEKNRRYYYAVQSARVSGKPRIVWQKYLGMVDAIVKRAEQAAPPKPKETVLRRLPKAAFSSQRFWDHMDMVSEEVIDCVQGKLTARIERGYGLDRNVLLYDTTNFFAFLATSDSRGSIAKRGRSKAKRHDLRQVGLALFVTREGQVPIFHRVYTGNITDVSPFGIFACGKTACRAWRRRTALGDTRGFVAVPCSPRTGGQATSGTQECTVGVRRSSRFDCIVMYEG